MPTSWRRWTLRELALFVAVAAIVSMAGMVVGCEAGIGGETDASVASSGGDQSPAPPEQQLGEEMDASVASSGSDQSPAPPEQQPRESGNLHLTLSAPEQICETKHPRPYGMTSSYQDDEGEWIEETELWGWTGLPSLPVHWTVTGGESPYALVVDNESGGEQGDYLGATGTAFVGCGETSGGTSFDQYDGRIYPVDLTLDSGWKTIRAIVHDGEGATAEAVIEVYVLLDLGGGTTGDILSRGETYRIDGQLMTAPEAYDVRVGSVAERECSERDPDPRCGDTTYGYSIVGTDAWISLYEGDGALHARWWPPLSESSLKDEQDSTESISSAVTSLVESIGKLPKRHKYSE